MAHSVSIRAALAHTSYRNRSLARDFLPSGRRPEAVRQADLPCLVEPVGQDPAYPLMTAVNLSHASAVNRS